MFTKNYKDVLLNATYKKGKVGVLTQAHQRAEHHPFKTKHLFKETIIPKNLYVARLVQHFLIIQALEQQLLGLNEKEKAELDAFFTLSFLDQLWRTAAIQNDLEQLGIEVTEISDKEITKSTKKYLNEIQELQPKVLLTHYLLHVAGFMHGGNIIQKKYIAPSNKLTEYQIATQQYNFSSLWVNLPQSKQSVMGLYGYIMSELDAIELSDSEYAECLQQGQSIYETMANIYDDLCTIHINHSKCTLIPLSLIGVSMIALGLTLKLLLDSNNALDAMPRFSL